MRQLSISAPQLLPFPSNPPSSPLAQSSEATFASSPAFVATPSPLANPSPATTSQSFFPPNDGFGANTFGNDNPFSPNYTGGNPFANPFATPSNAPFS